MEDCSMLDGTNINSPTGGDKFEASECLWCNFINLMFDYAGAASGQGLDLFGVQHAQVRGLKFRGQGASISLDTNTHACRNIYVSHSEFHQNTGFAAIVSPQSSATEGGTVTYDNCLVSGGNAVNVKSTFQTINTGANDNEAAIMVIKNSRFEGLAADVIDYVGCGAGNTPGRFTFHNNIVDGRRMFNAQTTQTPTFINLTGSGGVDAYVTKNTLIGVTTLLEQAAAGAWDNDTPGFKIWGNETPTTDLGSNPPEDGNTNPIYSLSNNSKLGFRTPDNPLYVRTFNGGQSVTLPAVIGNTAGSPYSIAFRARTSADGANRYALSGGQVGCFYNWSGGAPRFNSNGPVGGFAPTDVTVGQWYIVVVTKGADDIQRAYVGVAEFGNLSLRKTGSSGHTSAGSGNLHIGSLDGASQFWFGDIKDVRVFNTQLTATEVNEYGNDTHDDTGLLGKWLLDESDPTVTQATDSSGNNNHGTYVGF
jgi:hypothetical protein